MINYNEFYELLKKVNLITPIWKYELDLISNEIKNEKNKDYYLIIFAIYFSLVNSGNICISLDKDILSNKWNKQVLGSLKLEEDKDDFDLNIFDEIKNISNEAFNYLNEINNLNVVGINHIFEKEDGYLYLKKYNHARVGIIKSIDRLFNIEFKNENKFKLNDIYKKGFSLNEEQEKIVKEGLNKNLIITGGPGTGKTTTILFILLNLLANNLNYNIYLAAASGKAAGNMNDSIKGSLNLISDDFINSHQDIINKIKGSVSDEEQKIEEFTIHRLLCNDFNTQKFKYNENNQFENNSIFIIDEASMIDVNIFNSLLNAIPTNARLFILGDKNQLPSVEAGAVFSDLLNKLKNNKIELVTSQRFKEGSPIDLLAKKVNNGLDLELNESDFKNYKEFEVLEFNKGTYLLNYYNNDGNKEIIPSMVSKWVKNFYQDNDIISASNELDKDNISSNELNEIFKFTTFSKIISAENNGPRGVNTINYLVKKLIYKKDKLTKNIINKSLNNHYAGEPMMINKNNKALDLYNGDCGILVTFKNDDTLYFMVNKEKTKLNLSGERKKDNIFKIDNYIFYPFRLISANEIDLAYAITVHKSQGSGYENIFVILPITKGHPLLNRQIVYTAITRTKGNTYILSNLEMLNEAKSTELQRDTNVI